MTRYINAELIERHINREEHYTPDERWRPESEFAKLIDSIPTADVVEVVHGEWERIEKKDESRIINVDFRCSVCRRFRFHNGELRRYKYCPNCGAKMNGEKVE